MISSNFAGTAAAAAAEAARRLSPAPRYLAVKGAITARAQGSQNARSMPAEQFAAKVADAALDARSQIRLRAGRQLWPYTGFKPSIPSPVVNRMLSRRFELDKVAAR